MEYSLTQLDIEPDGAPQPYLFVINTPANIPPRLIQTAKTRHLAPLAKAASTNLKLLHPDWEYLFFDDEDVVRFIHDEFPEYRNVFESFAHRIQRFDFFRYLAVFRHGGFYFDLDVLLSEAISGLLSHRCVFPFEELTLNRHLLKTYSIDWEIGNYAFGATAGDPFLAAVISNCVRAQQDHAWTEIMMRGLPTVCRSNFIVLNTTGPGLLTRTFAENPALARDVMVLYPDDVCDPKAWHHFGKYGVHLMEGSWRSGGSLLRRKLALGWENWTRRRLLKESRARGRSRVYPTLQGT